MVGEQAGDGLKDFLGRIIRIVNQRSGPGYFLCPNCRGDVFALERRRCDLFERLRGV